MTTMTANPGAAPARTSVSPVSFPRVVTSEWIKFRSVRSTAWALPITAVVMVGLSVLQAWALTGLPADNQAPINAATIVTGGWFLAQLVVSVLGVLAITAEYSTGMIRSTLAAVPRRLPALWGKSLVLFVVVFVVSLVAVALAWVATLPFLNDLGLAVDLGDADQLRVVLGTPLYLATIAVLAFAIGALIRHSAGGLALVLGLLLVIETVIGAIPLAFFENVAPYLPSTAGSRVATESGLLGATLGGVDLTPWQGYGVLVAWVVLLLAAAAVLLRRRDA